MQIKITDNPLLIAAFGIAGAIAVIGACFFCQLAYLAFKALRQQYNRYLVEQMQLAITLKQARLVKE